MREALALHNNKGAKKRRTLGFPPRLSSRGSNGGGVEIGKQGIVKPSFRLVGKQTDVLYDFLTIDNDQLLWFGLFCVQLNDTTFGWSFLYIFGDKLKKPNAKTCFVTALVVFCSWLLYLK